MHKAQNSPPSFSLTADRKWQPRSHAPPLSHGKDPGNEVAKMNETIAWRGQSLSNKYSFPTIQWKQFLKRRVDEIMENVFLLLLFK